MILKASGSKSKGSANHTPSEDSRVESFLISSSFLSLPVIPLVASGLYTYHSNICLCLQVPSPLREPPWPNFSLAHIDIRYVGFRTHPLQYDLILADYICKDLFQIRPHSLVSALVLERHYSTQYK